MAPMRQQNISVGVILAKTATDRGAMMDDQTNNDRVVPKIRVGFHYYTMKKPHGEPGNRTIMVINTRKWPGVRGYV
jgi:hypothetical protein